MWMSRKPIDIPAFNRNPLRVRPHFVVPRHHHNFDEMLFVFAGRVQHRVRQRRRGTETVVVARATCFVSHAGTPYTMTAGPDGVVYIETWPKPDAPAGRRRGTTSAGSGAGVWTDRYNESCRDRTRDEAMESATGRIDVGRLG